MTPDAIIAKLMTLLPQIEGLEFKVEEHANITAAGERVFIPVVVDVTTVRLALGSGEEIWDVLIKPSDAAFVRLARALVALGGRWIDSAKVAEALCVRVVLPAETWRAFKASVKPVRMDPPPQARL